MTRRDNQENITKESAGHRPDVSLNVNRIQYPPTIPKVHCSEDPLFGLVLWSGSGVTVTIAYVQNSGLRNSGSDSHVLHSFSIISVNIAVSDISLKTWLFALHFCRRKYRCIFNHFYAMGLNSYRIWRNNANYTTIMPLKVIQGHRFWYQSKARIQLAISD